MPNLGKLAWAVALAAIACKPTNRDPAPSARATAAATAAPADPWAEHRRAFETVKAKLGKVYQLRGKYPARVPESLKPLDNGAFALVGKTTTAALDYEYPESMTDALDYRFLDKLAGTTTDCSLATSKDKVEDLKPEELDALEVCKNFRYYVVVRLTSLTKPQLGATTFSPGAIAADVLVYNLDTLTLLGGFAVRAKNSETVSADSNRGSTGAEDAMKRDLADNLQAAAAQRWQALAKNADFPKP